MHTYTKRDACRFEGAMYGWPKLSRTICVLVVLCAVVLVDLYYGANAAGLGDPRVAWVELAACSQVAARKNRPRLAMPRYYQLICVCSARLSLCVLHILWLHPYQPGYSTVASLKKKMHQTGW